MSIPNILFIFSRTTFAVVLAQGQFALGQTSASIGATSSGDLYGVRAAIGEPRDGIASGGAYQVIGSLTLGGELPPAATFALSVTKNGEGFIYQWFAAKGA